MPTSTVLSQRWNPVTERGKGRRDTCRGKEMDSVPVLRSENTAAAFQGDRAEGLSALLSEVQAGDHYQCKEFYY